MQHKFTPTTHLKRAALTLLALIMTCATAWAQFGGGDGSPANPYLINKRYNGTTSATPCKTTPPGIASAAGMSN